MVVFHGTTRKNALRIQAEGFLPRKPSKRVWFTQSKEYAKRRARHKAKRTHDRPVVLTCDLDVHELKRRLGGRSGVRVRNRIVVVNGPVSASVLRSHPQMLVPRSKEDLARWINEALGLKPHKGVGKNHPGIDRLSRWIDHRMAANPQWQIKDQEIIELANQWLPEYFRGAKPDFKQYSPSVQDVEDGEQEDGSQVEADLPEVDRREEEALDCLMSEKPKRRIRGLSLLAKLKTPDLFEWCLMVLEDEAPAVRVAALETINRCGDVETELIEPLASSEDKLVRAAAIAVMAGHAGEAAPEWFRCGLTDPDPHVRVNTARYLPALDPVEHRAIFELALYDPNPAVARLAGKFTSGKGFARMTW